MIGRVSVIMPATREDHVVEETIRSLTDVLYVCSAELLVVDNTRYATLERVVNANAQNVRYVHEPVVGLLSARHRGFEQAKGDLLVYIDDDVTVNKTWLTGIVEAFKDSEVHLVGGRCLPLYEVPPPAWIKSHFTTTITDGWHCSWLSLIDQGDRVKDCEPDFVFGLNFAIRKSTLVELGGFHPDCVPEFLQYIQGDGETGLTRKLHERGLRAVYQPKASLQHRIPASRLTPLYFCKRAFYQGICDSYTRLRALYRRSLPSAWVSTVLREVSERTREYLRRVQYYHNLGPVPSSETDINELGDWVRKAVARSEIAGRMFHFEAVRRQPELVDWIKRDDYWDYTHPDIALDACAIRAWALNRCNVPLRW